MSHTLVLIGVKLGKELLSLSYQNKNKCETKAMLFTSKQRYCPETPHPYQKKMLVGNSL